MSLWSERQTAVTSVMDGSVQYVDLAAMAGRYSFRLTGLHSGGESKEVKEEQEKEQQTERLKR